MNVVVAEDATAGATDTVDAGTVANVVDAPQLSPPVAADSAESTHEFVAIPNLLIIKDEPQDDPEMTEEVLTLNDDTTVTSEVDPMNLLEPAEEHDFYEVREVSSRTLSRSIVTESGVEEDEEDKDSSQTTPHDESRITTVDNLTSARNEEKWQEWLSNQQHWLLSDDLDPDWAYCLYCDVKITCKNKYYYYARNHSESGNHKDRAENYIAFQRNAEKASEGSPLIDIKQEFGTSSSTEAIKFKRMSQTEPLNNFNWRRWLQAHEWLVRDHPEGVMGYCKYCNLRLNVEFLYQRERHEQSKKHKEYLKTIKHNQEKDAAKRGVNADGGPGDEPMETDAIEEANAEDDAEEEANDTAEEVSSNDNVARRLPHVISSNPWFKLMSNRTYGRCRLCDCKMIALSFRKHIKSKIHLENLRLHIQNKKRLPKPVAAASTVIVKQEFENKWKIFEQTHPWLIADPKDGTFAYCKYCERRQMYGLSSIKRTQHENSVGHKEAVKQYEEKLVAENDEQVAEENDNENENDDDQGQSDNESEAGQENEDDENDDNAEDDAKDDNESSVKAKRMKRGSEAWLKMYPWCRRNANSLDTFLCAYCNISLSLLISRRKHETCSRHIQNEKNYLRKKVNARKGVYVGKQYTNYERSLKDKRVHFYPWLVYTKNNPNSVFCKYCRARYSSSLSRVQHQHTKRHIEAAKQYLVKNKVEQTNFITPQSPSPPPSPSIDDAEKSEKPKEKSSPSTALPPKTMHGKVLLWKNRFPWLSYKRNEHRPNYGYCKYCDQRIFVPTLKFAAKHQRSAKHIRTRLLIKRQRQQEAAEAEEQEQEEDETEEDEAEEDEAEEDEAEENEDEATNHNKNKENEKISTVPIVAEERELVGEWKTMQLKYAWLIPDKNKQKDFGYCKVCELRIPLKALNLSHHRNTKQHRAKWRNRNSVKIAAVADSDVDMRQLNDEDVDDAEDVMSVKSESADDGGLAVLECLLERSMSYKQKHQKHSRNSDDATETNELPAAKRAHTMQHDSTTAAIDTARQLTAAHGELLRMTRQFNDTSGSSSKRARNSLPANLLTSSFSIAACLSPLMQQLAPPPASEAVVAPAAARTPTPQPPPPPPAERNTYDLFFDSVSETVKKLPNDLGIEARMRVMQIIYDLELRAQRRNQPNEPYNRIEVTATPSKEVQTSDNTPQSPPEVAATSTTTLTKPLPNGYENGEHSSTNNNRTLALSSENSFHLIPISLTPPRNNINGSNVSSQTAASIASTSAPTSASAPAPTPTPPPLPTTVVNTFTNSALSSIDKTVRRIRLNPAVQITRGSDSSTSTASAANIRCININSLTQQSGGARGVNVSTRTPATTAHRPPTTFIAVPGSTGSKQKLQRGGVTVNLPGKSVVTSSQQMLSNINKPTSTNASSTKQFATILHAPSKRF